MIGEADETASQHGEARSGPELASSASLDAPAGSPPLAPAGPPSLAPGVPPPTSELRRSNCSSALDVPILQPAPPPSPTVACVSPSTPAVAPALAPVASDNNAKANAPTKPSKDGEATSKKDKGKRQKPSSEDAAKPIRSGRVSAFICGACIVF